MGGLHRPAAAPGPDGATVRTLRTFIASYWDLVRAVDEILLPNPDLR